MKTIIFSTFVIFSLLLGIECACPIGTIEGALCILDNSDCAVGGTCVDNVCCNPVATTAATTVTVTGTVVTTASTVNGSLGPCFDNECPTGFQCNTDLQQCFPTGCIGACFDNECPTGYTCNTATQLCCSSNTSTTSATTTCRDLIGPRGYSDCPARASLCNNTVYYTLMTQQCPRTCNRCTTAGATTVSTTCVDLTRANGTSDCPQLAYLCNNTIYSTLMTQQCPRTCGRCTTG